MFIYIYIYTLSGESIMVVSLSVSSFELEFWSGVRRVRMNLTFSDIMFGTVYPLRRESRWLKDHDKLPRSAVPAMNGSKEVRGAKKDSNELQ